MKTTRNGGSTFNADRVLAVGTSIKKIAAELAEIFPERDELIQQIAFALATRQNVLTWGTFGTGKTDLLHTLFGAFTGATVFSVAMDKFMTHSHLFGIPNPKKMREEGELVYPVNGILSADFAELDELFDANDAVLRTLLGVLNERQFKRGRQVERVKLHTAVACTNGTPDEELKRRPSLGAVIDRFIYHARVDYLKTRESRLQMYHKFLEGRVPELTVPFTELQYLSGIVTGANQITDPTFIGAYEELVEAFTAATKKVVSDRRKCKFLEAVEAEALMNGRYQVHPEDLQAVRWGICTAGVAAEHEAFKKVAGPIIEKAVKEMKSPIDEAEVTLLKEFQAQLPAVPADKAVADDLVACARALMELKRKVTAVKPQLASTRDLKATIIKEVTSRAVAVQTAITDGK